MSNKVTKRELEEMKEGSGASHKKPLCDGTHLLIGFKD